MIGFKTPHDLEMAIRNDVLAKLFKEDKLPNYHFKVERSPGPIHATTTGHIYNYQRDEARLNWQAKIRLINPKAQPIVANYDSATKSLRLVSSHCKELLEAMRYCFTAYDPTIKITTEEVYGQAAYYPAPNYDTEQESEQYCNTCEDNHDNVAAYHMDQVYCELCDYYFGDGEDLCAHLNDPPEQEGEGDDDE